MVFRQSCIYGPHQLGAEEQGWLAWFVMASRTGTPLTIYGDGKQVRDLLYVDDLIDCYGAALAAIDVTAGQIYNVGGGVRPQRVGVVAAEAACSKQALGTRARRPVVRPVAPRRPAHLLRRHPQGHS